MKLERSLPNSAEAERAILGAILLNNALAIQAQTELLPEQFYLPSHRQIFVAMLALVEAQSEISPVLVAELLERENSLEAVGGLTFLTNLTYGLPRSDNLKHYAKIVREKAALRQLIKLTAKIASEALEHEEEAATILERAEAAMFDLAMQTRVASKSTLRTYDQIATGVVELFEQWSDGNASAIPTRIPELDHRLASGGFSAGDFVVIAARTSFGKSAMALQIALNAARAGTPILFFSLEMRGERLFIRNLSSVTGVAHNEINPWTFQHDRVLSSKIVAGIGQLAGLPIQVEDRVHGLNRLCSIARDWRRRATSPGMIIGDYMQLVNNKLSARSREQEVAGVSTEFKRLGVELDVPVIGISQLSREQAKQNRRPELSDLRESGQIENDCDVVLFPYSTETLEDKPVRSMKLYCPKQRSGKSGWEIGIDFDAEHQWFYTDQLYLDGRQTA